jgi:uroporphyrinogen decarboxylase
MEGRERIKRILNGEEVDRSGFWIGNPTPEAQEIYCRELGLGSLEELSRTLGDDLFWIKGEDAEWKHPEKKVIFDVIGNRKDGGKEGPIFSDVEDVGEIEKAYWPDPKYYDFLSLKPLFDRIRESGRAIFSGMWSPIWHMLHFYFGMEKCFIKMYTAPAVIHAVCERLTDFYIRCNEILFDLYADYIDAFFFGNDLGTQSDCMISPEMYREFVFPYMRKIISGAKSRGIKVALHSCGSIYRIIPDIIEMGVDILHPIQTRARGMEFDDLQREYGKDLVFMGGLDTQELLPFKSEKEVYEEALRLRRLSGKRFILSPSHEALLPNVSVKNVLAMSAAAKVIL